MLVYKRGEGVGGGLWAYAFILWIIWYHYLYHCLYFKKKAQILYFYFFFGKNIEKIVTRSITLKRTYSINIKKIAGSFKIGIPQLIIFMFIVVLFLFGVFSPHFLNLIFFLNLRIVNTLCATLPIRLSKRFLIKN